LRGDDVTDSSRLERIINEHKQKTLENVRMMKSAHFYQIVFAHLKRILVFSD